MSKHQYPSPKKTLITPKDVQEYITDLVFNTLGWLKLDGYIFFIYLPGEQDHVVHKNAGLSISLDYPYKKFFVSIQQDSIDKCLKSKPSDPIWKNIEASVFHEVFHIILWKLGEIARKRYITPTELEEEDEYTVDHLTHVFYPMLEDLRKKDTNGKEKKDTK